MGSSDRFWFRPDSEAHASAIEDYAEKNHDENVSEALCELTRAGLRQQATPVARWRSDVRTATSWLVMVSVAVVVIGVGTPAIAQVFAVQVGAMLSLVAISGLALFEIAQRATAPIAEVSGGEKA